MTDDEKAAKGRKGETELQAWFDRYYFAYVRVEQNEQTFAKLFRGSVKRPDFLVLVDSIGMIAVDAKYTAPRQNGCYSLGFQKELQRAVLFERLFRLPVWYAYRGENASTWHWISALKAIEVGVPAASKKDFLEIAPEEFACLKEGADFASLYAQRLPRLTNLRKFRSE